MPTKSQYEQRQRDRVRAAAAQDDAAAQTAKGRPGPKPVTAKSARLSKVTAADLTVFRDTRLRARIHASALEIAELNRQISELSKRKKALEEPFKSDIKRSGVAGVSIKQDEYTLIVSSRTTKVIREARLLSYGVSAEVIDRATDETTRETVTVRPAGVVEDEE